MSADQLPIPLKGPWVEEGEHDPQIPLPEKAPVVYETDHTVGSLLDACLAAKGPMTNRK